MTEANSKADEVILTLVYEGVTAEAHNHDTKPAVTERGLLPSEQSRPSARQGFTLPPDLLAQVDLTPRATAPQSSWGWEIAGYLYLGGLGAGAFIVAVLLDWMGLRLPTSQLAVYAGWNWDWAAVFAYWGPAITAVGASLLIFHLGRNWFLFFTACFNPRSSWLARGFLILATFIIVGCLAAAVAVFFPGWPRDVPAAWRAVQAIGLVFACGTAIYTGILLRSMKYIPAWNAALLPALFFVSALSTGAMGIAVGALLVRLFSGERLVVQPVIARIEAIEPALLLVEGAVLLAYMWRLTKGKPEARLSATMLVSGSWRYPFWAGVVCGALGLPLVLAFFSRVLVTASSSLQVFGAEVEVANVLMLVAAVSVLCGGFVLRLGVLGVGIKERPPLYGMSMWRAEHGLPLVAHDFDDKSRD